MFRPHKIKWSDYRSKIVPDAKRQPIRHSQMERLLPSPSPFYFPFLKHIVEPTLPPSVSRSNCRRNHCITWRRRSGMDGWLGDTAVYGADNLKFDTLQGDHSPG